MHVWYTNKIIWLKLLLVACVLKLIIILYHYLHLFLVLTVHFCTELIAIYTMAYMAEKAIREQQPHDVLKSKHLMVTSDSCQLEPPDRRWQKSLSLSLYIYIPFNPTLPIQDNQGGLFWATGPPKGKSHQIIYQVSPPRSQRRSASPGLWMIKLAPLDRVWMSLGGFGSLHNATTSGATNWWHKTVFGHVFVSEQKCSHWHLQISPISLNHSDILPHLDNPLMSPG